MLSGMTEDEQLRLALEASARDHQSQHTGLVIGSSFCASRTDIDRPDWPDAPATPATGHLLQFNTFDQFNPSKFGQSIKEFQAPTAICGYASLAAALFLAEQLPAGGLKTREEAELFATRLQDADALLPDIRAAMKYVRDCRTRYIDSHKAAFPTRRDQNAYMQAWVANYEISDFLRSRGADATLLFMRFNQWPERSSATHEEAERLQEESRFGGKVGDKSQAVHDFKGGDAMVVVEEFGSGTSSLYKPREWLLQRDSDRPTRSAVVMDLNGHFAAATPVADWDGHPAMVVFNTTMASYLSGAGGLITAAAFDLFFSPKPSITDDVSCAESSSINTAVAERSVQRLRELGVATDAEARQLLKDAQNSVQIAAERWLSG